MALANQEAETKIAPVAGLEYDRNSDDDDGSTLSTDSWERNFYDLREHMCVDYPNGGFVSTDKYSLELGYWISQQRIQYQRKALGYACLLSEDRIQKLEDIGFWWEDGNPALDTIEIAPPSVAAAPQKLEPEKQMPSRKSKEWTHHFEGLKRHMKWHNCDDGVDSCSKCSQELLNWVNDQRRKYWTKKDHGPFMTNTISDEHIRKLEKIGFSWGSTPNKTKRSPSTSCEVLNPTKKQREDNMSSRRGNEKRMSSSTMSWEAHYELLVKYMEHHGSGYIVPAQSSSISSQKFYRWVGRQRSEYRTSRLSEYKIAKLESIGFLWERPEESTAKEVLNPSEDDDESGWLTQDTESHHSSNWGDHGSPVNDAFNKDFAGYSDANSNGSESCSAEERVSEAAMSESQDKCTTPKAITICADIDHDSKFQHCLQQIAMYSRKANSCLKEQAATFMERELAWKKKDALYKASLCESKEQMQSLKELSQKAQESNEEKIQQLEKHNTTLMKELVETQALKDRFEALQKSHESEMEKRIEAEATLQAAKKLNFEQLHAFSSYEKHTKNNVNEFKVP